MNRSLETRVEEIALVLNVPASSVRERLELGFGRNHVLVAEDFNNAGVDVNDSASLLEWYRTTDAYIYELSAYHLDPGFNYSGMCEGVVNHCTTNEWPRVLCLGDGIGDLSLTLKQAGLEPTYNDLKGSKNALYAKVVSGLYTKDGVPQILTEDWVPTFPTNYYHAVVALDFFEHLVNVDEWVATVYESLRDGGGFLAQNAFGIGDEEHGNSIPMHLSVNNKYEFVWDKLMEDTGFTRNIGGWWVK